MSSLGVALVGGLAAAGCTVPPTRIPVFDTGPGAHDVGPVDAAIDASEPRDVGTDIGNDAPHDAFLTGDAACESATNPATLTRLPADIIWVIDNSGSMAGAINAVQAGINDFASQLVMSDLDYRMIVLSLRGSSIECTTNADCASHAGTTECQGGHCGPSGRYAVCVPEPLAGPGCADGPNFFQVPIDIKSTKPIEQILGTLAQTAGYTSGSDGGPPWRSLLRDGATRTFVLVTDDNARTCALPGSGTTCSATDPPLTATSLEDFPGPAGDPFNSSTLGPGILDPSYGDLFTGYTFDAIYGWGSETDPDVHCGIGSTPSPGQTYTTLVQRTGGVRAQICDGAAAFGPFFTAIRDSVLRGSPIECNVVIPDPPPGMTFQSGRVNVILRTTTEQTYFGHVSDVGHCDPVRGGWYYDDNTTPTQILLCPTSCADAQSMVVGTGTGLDVQFGCQSILI